MTKVINLLKNNKYYTNYNSFPQNFMEMKTKKALTLL